ncbi:hypothetical protein GDO81_019981 [Engystomops pustulosus]|uniref:Uncharacterized protein n=1 Tax=Engystomops pustulosus TaxID=76066 RepID=A0AAV6ZCD1_ENGPU|nr:hypothetical protein GDO81_019981 [Engystomops pustulosus]
MSDTPASHGVSSVSSTIKWGPFTKLFLLMMNRRSPIISDPIVDTSSGDPKQPPEVSNHSTTRSKCSLTSQVIRTVLGENIWEYVMMSCRTTFILLIKCCWDVSLPADESEDLCLPKSFAADYLGERLSCYQM